MFVFEKGLLALQSALTGRASSKCVIATDSHVGFALFAAAMHCYGLLILTALYTAACYLALHLTRHA